MKKFIPIFAFLVLGRVGLAQELYPNSEPASIIPKNALGVRLMNEAYYTSGNLRAWNGAMFMYGVSSKLMLNGMVTGSNHHGVKLPDNFIQDGTGQSGTIMPTSPAKNYSYLFESVNLGFRYRFLNLDGDHRHFRMAVYGNGVYSDRPHDEAEVTLMGDNKGVGGGIISTVLIKKLAVSFTGGIIRPFSYKEASGLALKYGEAYNYSLSFGYLLYPFRYKNFNETNVNLYAEFIGKTYSPIVVTRHGAEVASHMHEGLTGGSYMELRPAVQFIVKSNLRVDLATSLPIVKKSYIRQYPLYQLNIQYYFFL